FCLQLVKRYAPEIPLPPIFEIDPQEDRFNALFENRWDEFLSQLLASQVASDQAIIHSLGVKTLRDVAENLVKSRYDFPLEEDDCRWVVDELANGKKWGSRKGTWVEFAARLMKDFESHRDVLSAIVQMKYPGVPLYRTRLKALLACKNIDLHKAIAIVQQRF